MIQLDSAPQDEESATLNANVPKAVRSSVTGVTSRRAVVGPLEIEEEAGDKAGNRDKEDCERYASDHFPKSANVLEGNIR